MQLFRPALAARSSLFGRGPVRNVEIIEERGNDLLADLRLFAATFLAGFLFISILIG